MSGSGLQPANLSSRTLAVALHIMTAPRKLSACRAQLAPRFNQSVKKSTGSQRGWQSLKIVQLFLSSPAVQPFRPRGRKVRHSRFLRWALALGFPILLAYGSASATIELHWSHFVTCFLVSV